MKNVFLLFILVFSIVIVKAQGDYNYSPYAVGFGTSAIKGFTNVNKQNTTLAVNANFTYYYTPYVPFTAELQAGRLWGGSRITDPNKREYVNNYTALIFHTEIQLGEIIDYTYSDVANVAKNIYFGPGFGFIHDNVQNQRTNLVANSQYAVGQYTFPGNDKSLNSMVSLKAGYEFKFYNEYDEPYLRLDVEYTQNIVYGEGLDGYNDPTTYFHNHHADEYRQLSIGVKYSFGLIRAYTKRIRGLY